MPELPEVENVVRGLRPLLVGRQFRRVQILNPAIVKAGLEEFEVGVTDQVIQGVERRGKYILLRLASGNWLVFHLGMTGRLYFAIADEPLEKHTHLIFEMERTSRQLRHADPRRFGGAYFLNSQGMKPLRRLQRLGPEPLELDIASFQGLFAGRKARMKALLLDQGFLAGIGNIYADEALHRAGIHPAQLSDSVSGKKLLLLHRCIRRVLRHAIQEGGSSISDYVDPEGYRGQYQNFYRVYGRELHSCRKRGCRGTIRRAQVAGRSSHYCPYCQRLRVRRRRR